VVHYVLILKSFVYGLCQSQFGNDERFASTYARALVRWCTTGNAFKVFIQEFRISKFDFLYSNKCDRQKYPIGFRVDYCGAGVDRLGERLINDRFQDICGTRPLHIYGICRLKYAIMRCPKISTQVLVRVKI
jgi:hypothetical protein